MFILCSGCDICAMLLFHIFCVWGNHTYHTGFFTEETGNPPFFKLTNQDSMESCSGMASQCHDLARILKANNIRVEARENGGGQNGLKSGWVVGGVLHMYLNK